MIMDADSKSEFQTQLIPFSPENSLPIVIACSGSIGDHQSINLNYTLSGALDNIVFDKPVNGGKRTDNLWERTCFEIFIKTDSSTNYWEYNLSPAKNWAIYRFSRYREGKFDELSITSVPINIDVRSNEFTLQSTIPLPKQLIGQKLNIGLSSVVQDKNGVIYYYAITHLNKQADFHDGNSFVIEVQS